MIFNRITYNWFSGFIAIMMGSCWFWSCDNSWGWRLLAWVAFWSFDRYIAYRCRQKRKAKRLTKT